VREGDITQEPLLASPTLRRGSHAVLRWQRQPRRVRLRRCRMGFRPDCSLIQGHSDVRLDLPWRSLLLRCGLTVHTLSLRPMSQP
jgi:hypothetical protein